MPQATKGSSADAPTASSGVHGGDPDREPEDREEPLPDPTEDNRIPEEERENILAQFSDKADDDDQDEEPDLEEEGEDDDDDDEEGDDADDIEDDDIEDDGEDDEDEPDPEGEDGDESDEGEDDDEFLDEIESKLDERDQAEAFARLRTSLRYANQRIEALKDQAQVGEKLELFLDANGITEEAMHNGLTMMSLAHQDPIKAIGAMQEFLAETVAEAEKRYPDVDLSGVLEREYLPEKGKLPSGLQAAVDEGLLSEDEAWEYAKGGSDDDSDEERDNVPTVSDKMRIEQTQASLRKIGFYEGCKTEAEVDKRIDDYLIPRLGEIAEEMEIDLESASQQTRDSLLFRAARDVVANLRKAGADAKKRKGKKKRGKMLRSNEGESPRPKRKKRDFKNQDDMFKSVISEFK